MLIADITETTENSIQEYYQRTRRGKSAPPLQIHQSEESVVGHGESSSTVSVVGIMDEREGFLKGEEREGGVVHRAGGGEEREDVAESSGTPSLPSQQAQSMLPAFRDIDLQDLHKVEEFCKIGCGCSAKCSMQFSIKHYLQARADAQQMHRKELDHWLQEG